jgi:PAS domain S-box-containing protein
LFQPGFFDAASYFESKDKMAERRSKNGRTSRRQKNSSLPTRNKRAAVRLSESEGRFRSLAEAAPVGIFLTKPTGECIYANPVWSAISGLTSKESLRFGWMRAIHPDDRHRVEQSWRATAARRDKFTIEYRVVTPAGDLRWVRALATPRVDASGAVVSYVGSVEDVTERKRTEQKAWDNLQRIEALQAIGQAITSSLDLHSVLNVLLEKIEFFLPIATARTVRLLNRETEKFEFLACRGVDEKYWNQSRIGARSRKIIETKTPLSVLNINTDPLTSNLEVFREYGLVSYLGVPMIAKDEVLGVLGIYTNREHHFSDEEIASMTTLAAQAAIAIDNARLYEQTKMHAADLENSNRIKDEFLSVMSHELRTPLTAIAGYVGMMKDRLLGEINQQQENSLQKVLSRAADQLAMINDIMQTTQLEAHAATVERHSIDLKAVIQNLRSDYELTLPRKRIAVTWDYPSEPMLMTTDSGKIRQILQNLINNAIKFTDEGAIAISVRVTGVGIRGSGISSDPRLATLNSQSLNPNSRFVEFIVADTGAGIPKDKLAQIFDKFYQVDSSETRLYGGVGLGLFIVKRFTEMLGGEVKVESEPGKGSAFTVRIPCGA